MSAAEPDLRALSVPVPFQTLPDGRRILTDMQLAEDPELAAFVRRFPACFARNDAGRFHIFYPGGDAPAGGVK